MREGKREGEVKREEEGLGSREWQGMRWGEVAWQQPHNYRLRGKIP